MAPDSGNAAAASTAAVAHLNGAPVLEVPPDLYIPPDALEVFLESFQGPLDLLLYLIRRHNLDIRDIPVAPITAQYMEYLSLMRASRFELASEYLVMAAWLAEIKSRMLLPPVSAAEAAEDADPRAELVRRLLEYERFRQAAETLDALPRLERDLFPLVAAVEVQRLVRPQPDVRLEQLVSALQEVLRRADLGSHHVIGRDPLSVRERMGQMLERLGTVRFCEFHELFDGREGRSGVVVTFLALLELLRSALLEVVQNAPFSPIHVRLRGQR